MHARIKTAAIASLMCRQFETAVTPRLKDKRRQSALLARLAPVSCTRATRSFTSLCRGLETDVSTRTENLRTENRLLCTLYLCFSLVGVAGKSESSLLRRSTGGYGHRVIDHVVPPSVQVKHLPCRNAGVLRGVRAPKTLRTFCLARCSTSAGVAPRPFVWFLELGPICVPA